MSPPTLLLVGDSFGSAPKGGAVPTDCAWPAQVRMKATEWNVQADFAAFRRFVDVSAVIDSLPIPDVVIIEAGIVDCFPRPFSYALSRSHAPFARTARRLVRPIRGTWMRHVSRTTWATAADMNVALEKLARVAQSSRIGFVTAVPPLPKQSAVTPFAHDAVLAFNDRIRDFIAVTPNTFLIDLYALLVARGYLRFVDRVDGHLNVQGHDILASAVLVLIKAQNARSSGGERVAEPLGTTVEISVVG